MRTVDLYGATVIGRDGVKLGRVSEIYVEGGEVRALGVGMSNFLERLWGGAKGHRIQWAQVKKLEGGKLYVDRGPF